MSEVSENTPAPDAPVCHVCDEPIDPDGRGGSGLLLWVRGDHVVRETPPLCRTCGHAIGISALWRFAAEEDEG